MSFSEKGEVNKQSSYLRHCPFIKDINNLLDKGKDPEDINVNFTTTDEEEEGLLELELELEHQQSMTDTSSDHTYSSLSSNRTSSNLSHCSSSN